MAQIGQIIDGKFRISRLIGQGGMSRIYLAEDLRLQKPWAVKEIPKYMQGKDNTLYLQSALREAELIKNLDHPGIVRIVDMAEDADSLYIIEDYISGMPLKNLMKKGETIREKDLMNWAGQVIGILQYLHSRNPPVIYRDLKPENLILSDSGYIRLIDFGTARYYDPAKKQDTEYLGTRQYAAPEQYEEYGRQTDPRTDIYGFGMTMKTLARACPRVSSEFVTLIHRCTKENPDDRFPSALKLKKEFRRICRRKRNLSPVLVGLPVFLAVVLALCLGIGILSHRKSRCQQIMETVIDLENEGIFGKEEEEPLLKSVLPYLSEIQQEEGFEELAYQIGILYWYYYDYGSDHLAGMEAAIEWFQMSGQQNDMARAYEEIGRFLKKQTDLAQQTPEAGSFYNCFRQLEVLINGVKKGNYSSYVIAETFRLAGRLLNNYSEQFRKDGVPEESVRAFASEIGQNLSR